MAMVEKDKEQRNCNDRFDAIREWQGSDDAREGNDDDDADES